MTGRHGSIIAEITLEALFAFMGFEMQFELITIGEALIASLASQHLVACMQLLNMNSQISLSPTSSGAKFTLRNDIIS